MTLIASQKPSAADGTSASVMTMCALGAGHAARFRHKDFVPPDRLHVNFYRFYGLKD